MKNIILILTIFTSIVVEANECPPSEILVAECALPGKEDRKALICSSGEKNASLTYYFKNKNYTELKIDFDEDQKLKRWVDKANYTTYFGFKKGEFSYVIGIPQEKPNALAFLNVKKGKDTISSRNCLANSYGEKDIKNRYLDDVPDAVVRNSGFSFP